MKKSNNNNAMENMDLAHSRFNQAAASKASVKTLRPERSMPSMRYQAPNSPLVASPSMASLTNSPHYLYSLTPIPEIHQVQSDWARRMAADRGACHPSEPSLHPSASISGSSTAPSVELSGISDEDLWLLARTEGFGSSPHVDTGLAQSGAPSFIGSQGSSRKVSLSRIQEEVNHHRHGSDPTREGHRSSSSGRQGPSLDDVPGLPAGNASYDLAQFLKKTGPGTSPALPVGVKKSGFRGLMSKMKGKPRERSGTAESDKSMMAPIHLPPSMEIKTTKEGKKYVAIRPDLDQAEAAHAAKVKAAIQISDSIDGTGTPRLSINLSTLDDWYSREEQRQKREGFKGLGISTAQSSSRSRAASIKHSLATLDAEALSRSALDSAMSPILPSTSFTGSEVSTLIEIQNDPFPGRTMELRNITRRDVPSDDVSVYSASSLLAPLKIRKASVDSSPGLPDSPTLPGENTHREALAAAGISLAELAGGLRASRSSVDLEWELREEIGELKREAVYLRAVVEEFLRGCSAEEGAARIRGVRQRLGY